jgi:hypothetical protein
MKARLKEESWILADLSQRFYGYIFCKPLGDLTPLVEIVYEFKGVGKPKITRHTYEKEYRFFILHFSFLFYSRTSKR